MTILQCLAFVTSYWKEINEDEDVIQDELSSYESVKELASDCASFILDDKDEWSSDWINYAQMFV